MILTSFRFLWPCIMNVGWRERNQQDATNSMLIIKLLSQHVSGVIMPIIRRTRPCTTAYGVLHWLCWLWVCGAASWAVCTVWKSNSNFHTVHTAHDPAPHNHSQHNQCRTPYAVVHGLVILMMGIMMPETCWDSSLIINIGLVASCWFLSLHPMVLTLVSRQPVHSTHFPLTKILQTLDQSRKYESESHEIIIDIGKVQDHWIVSHDL